jgi:hypothetical protein
MKLNKFEWMIQDKFKSTTGQTGPGSCTIVSNESSIKDSSQEERRKKIFVPKLFRRNSSVTKKYQASKYQLRKKIERSFEKTKSTHQINKIDVKEEIEPESIRSEVKEDNFKYDLNDEIPIFRHALFKKKNLSDLSVIWHSTQSNDNWNSSEIDIDDNDSDLLIL